ncbi:microfibrillar-associated protein 1-like [Ischnura elegans]|uniref:microfibrillar-associated protein 1-like n=1 Tax=Ischnura elegans TaxID=197161 RepID=UPI001ED8BDC9|nr:microfibrillar-associated protein 1-like [Ischnura elegans]
MKTRRSLSGKDEPVKEALTSLPEHVVSSNTDSPSIVRKLRSRVITSDTEEDYQVRTRTPKSNRKVGRKNREDRESSTSPSNSVEVTAVPSILKNDVNSEKRTPIRNKRLSLFKIEEVKEEDKEEYEESIEEERTETKDFDASPSDNEDTRAVSDNAPVQKSQTVSDEIVEVKPSIPSESEEDTSDMESVNMGPRGEGLKEEGETEADPAEDEPISEEDSESDDDVPPCASFNSKSYISTEPSMIAEAVGKEEVKEEEYVNDIEEEIEEKCKTGTNNLAGDEQMGWEREEDSGSDDDVPEAVSFSSSKFQISSELSMIAEAVRKEKERRKERVRKKIEMIRSQKAEKEERRKQKLKYLEVRVPEKLPEDIASSLPDKPDIPTVKKPMSSNKKRKKEDKAENVEQSVEEKKNKILKFDDYIPLTDVAGSTQFGVVPLDVVSRLPKPSSQSAAEFKRNALFGSRIKREPSKNLVAYHQKLTAAGKFQKGFKPMSFLKT